nr:unnamed protein product [Callosobruchus analis]
MSGKKRSTNFSSREESVLVSLAKKYSNILECKLSDTMTHHKKHKCWEQIEKEFNTISGEVFRTKDVLRKKYDNIKKAVKKKYSNQKCYSQGTGGGPPKEEIFSEVDKEIKEILGTRIEGMASEFDGDAPEATTNSSGQGTSGHDIEDTLEGIRFIMDYDEVVIDHEYCKDSAVNAQMQDIVVAEVSQNESIKENIDNQCSLNSPGIYKKWTESTPKMLKSKKSSVLNTPKSKRENVTDRISQWAAAKHAFEEHKIKFLEEEQKLKLQAFKEKHDQELQLNKQKADLEMRLMEEAHRAKIKLQEQEHKLKMEILILQKKIE